jgi:hypothetical protein
MQNLAAFYTSGAHLSCCGVFIHSVLYGNPRNTDIHIIQLTLWTTEHSMCNLSVSIKHVSVQPFAFLRPVRLLPDYSHANFVTSRQAKDKSLSPFSKRFLLSRSLKPMDCSFTVGTSELHKYHDMFLLPHI